MKRTSEFFTLTKKEFIDRNLAEAIVNPLREVIRFHEYKYYVEAGPVTDDYTYDQLETLLRKTENTFPDLITSDSPTQRVGKDISSDFLQVPHKFPMLSLGNTYSEQELLEFDHRIKKAVTSAFQYVCELKFYHCRLSLVLGLLLFLPA